MNREIEHQKNLIEASGLGLLPGLALALAIAVLAILAVLLSNASWVSFAVLAVAICATAAIVWVVLQIASDEDVRDSDPPAYVR